MPLTPHGPGFSFLETFEVIVAGREGRGSKWLDPQLPFFADHFPGQPLMPGVLLIEAMAQTAGALCVAAQGEGGAPSLVYMMTIDKAKFRKPVVPGDQVRFHMTRVAKRRNMWWYRGEAKVDGVLVCEAEVSAMLVRE